MSNVIEAVDPRGFKVICTEQQWRTHILRKHKFLEGWEETIKKTIEKPSYGIFKDEKHPDRNIYYLRRSRRPFYIKVIVAFEGDNGSVLTAFPADYCKAGEQLIWPNSNP